MKQEEAILQELEKERREREEEEKGVDRSAHDVVSRLMIAGEAPIVMEKACEFMVMELAVRSWRHTEQNRRKTLQRQDVHVAVGENEMFDFLIDLVPRVLPSGPPPAEVPPMPAETMTNPTIAHPEGVLRQQEQQAPAVQQPQGAIGLSDAETRYAQLQEMQNQMQEHYSLMQERVMGEGGLPVQGLTYQTADERQHQQPQVVLNPQLMIHPPDGAAMPQWHPPASSGDDANPY